MFVMHFLKKGNKLFKKHCKKLWIDDKKVLQREIFTSKTFPVINSDVLAYNGKIEKVQFGFQKIDVGNFFFMFLTILCVKNCFLKSFTLTKLIFVTSITFF